MDSRKFQSLVKQGIPLQFPPMPSFDSSIDRAPVRPDVLREQEKLLAVQRF